MTKYKTQWYLWCGMLFNAIEKRKYVLANENIKKKHFKISYAMQKHGGLVEGLENWFYSVF